MTIAAPRPKPSPDPTDRALQQCVCGHAFTAPVSTTVTCPACGRTQDW
jgi:hypothetical protein